MDPVRRLALGAATVLAVGRGALVETVVDGPERFFELHESVGAVDTPAP